MVPFFAVRPNVRRVVYTTNAIEGVYARQRKIIKTRGQFPSDDIATKLIWLALRRLEPREPRLEGGDELVRDNLLRPTLDGPLTEAPRPNRVPQKIGNAPSRAPQVC